jgi:hypothetical protein
MASFSERCQQVVGQRIGVSKSRLDPSASDFSVQPVSRIGWRKLCSGIS